MTMPADVDTLKSTITRRGGVARANRFAIYVSHPGNSGLGGLINTDFASLAGNAARSLISGGSFSLKSFINDPRDMFLLCESVNIPGRQITTQEHYTSVRGIKKPNAFIDEDVSMTFNLTNDYYAWSYWQSWMDLVVQKQEDNFYTFGFKNNYTSDITIQQMGGVNFVPVKSIKLRNAYPISLNSVQLGNGQENTIATATVTIAYDYWEEAGVVEGLFDMAKNSIMGGLASAFF